MNTPLAHPPSALEAKLVILGAQGVGKTSLVNRFLDPRAPLSVQPTIGASFITKVIHDADSNTTVRLQIWDTAGQERFHSISKLYYRNAHAGILCYDVTSEQSWIEMKGWLEEIRQNCELDFEENKPGAGMIIHVVGTKLDLVADDPSKKEVAFERTIAYVAEHLVAGARNTSTVSQSSSFTPSLAIRPSNVNLTTLQHAKTPDSKRSSGLWYQDAGWDSCHEVSAKDNDGIEEIFRVISKRLIDQRTKREAYEQSQTPLPNSIGNGSDYFSSGRSGSAGARSGGGGSFRLGHGHRKSWLGLPTFGVTGLGLQYDEAERVDANGNYIKDPEEAKRRGRCC